MDREHWNIIPNHSANGLEFGGSRNSITAALGQPQRTFRKTGSSDNTTDDYGDFHVYYDKKDNMEAIEFFGNSITLDIDSKPVFPGKLSQIKELIPDLKNCYGSYISESLSIGITAEEDEIVSLLAGCENYYRR